MKMPSCAFSRSSCALHARESTPGLSSIPPGSVSCANALHENRLHQQHLRDEDLSDPAFAMSPTNRAQLTPVQLIRPRLIGPKGLTRKSKPVESPGAAISGIRRRHCLTVQGFKDAIV